MTSVLVCPREPALLPLLLLAAAPAGAVVVRLVVGEVGQLGGEQGGAPPCPVLA